MNTNTKQLATNGLLLAIGFLLHYITPAIGLPMQIDFSLITLILIVSLNKGNFGSCISAGIATGIFSGLTTKFPMGQVPNIIDKIVTTVAVYMLIKLLDKTSLSNKVKAIAVNAVGTIVSGTVFLVSALILVGLPTPFGLLFVSVVLPAIAVNTVAGLLIDSLFEKYRGRENETYRK